MILNHKAASSFLSLVTMGHRASDDVKEERPTFLLSIYHARGTSRQPYWNGSMTTADEGPEALGGCPGSKAK